MATGPCNSPPRLGSTLTTTILPRQPLKDPTLVADLLGNHPAPDQQFNIPGGLDTIHVLTFLAHIGRLSASVSHYVTLDPAHQRYLSEHSKHVVKMLQYFCDHQRVSPAILTYIPALYLVAMLESAFNAPVTLAQQLLA